MEQFIRSLIGGYLTQSNNKYFDKAIKLFSKFKKNNIEKFAGDYEWHILWWYSRNPGGIKTFLKTDWCRFFHKCDYVIIEIGNQVGVVCEKCQAKHFEFYFDGFHLNSDQYLFHSDHFSVVGDLAKLAGGARDKMYLLRMKLAAKYHPELF